MVVIIYADEVAQLQVAGRARSFTCDTFHGTPISEDAVSVIVEQIKAGLVEHCTGMCLSYSEPDRVGEALAQRSGGDFNAWSVTGFWMTWGDAIDMLEVLWSARPACRFVCPRGNTLKCFKSSIVT